MAEQPYDLAIVGAGQTGCALAGKIAEKGVNPKTGEPLKIALFDQGPYLKGKSDPGYGAPLRRQMFTNLNTGFAGSYRVRYTAPPGAKRKIPLKPGQEIFPTGGSAIFGGGTLHYTAQTRVAFEVDYKVWEEETGVDWSYQNLKPFADQVNRDLNIHVRPDALLCRLDHLFRDAAQSLGYQPVENTIAKKNCLLCGYCDGQNMCKYDARQGSFVVYLPIAEEHGVELMPDSKVERILFEKTGAQVQVKGLEYTHLGVNQRMEVPRVIVCGGSSGTPLLLFRSGYGPRELLDGNLVVENPNVGRGTDNRPLAPGPTAVFDEPVSDGTYRHRNAYFVYHDTNADQHYDRLQIEVNAEDELYPHRVALDATAPQFGRAHKNYMREIANSEKVTPARKQILRRAHSAIHLVRPRNVRGWMNEWGEHIYQANDPSVVKLLEDGRELIYEFMKEMGAREIRGMERPIRIRRLDSTVGTCHPGVDPKNSVVNPYFESHDIEGLFICDGSVIPRGATQAYAGTLVTVGLFAASRILERHFTRG